jgi:hypothetical protein
MEAAHHPVDTNKTRIAQLAAQLMADHGIRDHSLAKRKALRQLGLSANQAMPGNEEVDAALREYRALYEPEEQQADLTALRRQALEAMNDLKAFPLLLVGAVANGAVSRHSDIEFDLYLDATKSFEQFLLKEGIAYESSDRGGQARFLLYAEPANVQVRILPENAQHQARRGKQDGPSRLTRAQLEKLLPAPEALSAQDKSD